MEKVGLNLDLGKVPCRLCDPGHISQPLTSSVFSKVYDGKDTDMTEQVGYVCRIGTEHRAQLTRSTHQKGAAIIIAYFITLGIYRVLQNNAERKFFRFALEFDVTELFKRKRKTIE